jgi:nucleotide-binding universal stress UspA family protein
MKKILLATDLSRRSELALLRARLVARQTGATLTLAHVVDTDQPSPVADAHAAAAEAALSARRDEEGEPETRPLVLRGDVFWALRQAALEEAADLVVAGEHRRSWLRDAFRDTTVERLARVAPVPLLVARNPDPAPYRHAVIGIEGDEGPRLADVVTSLGGAAPARVTVIHAFDPVAAGMLATTGASRDEIASYRSELASRARERIRRSLPRAWAEAPLEALEGDAIPVLENAVRRFGADLVVASTHARRGLDRLILGSVSAHFIRQGSTDFLLVPAATA